MDERTPRWKHREAELLLAIPEALAAQFVASMGSGFRWQVLLALVSRELGNFPRKERRFRLRCLRTLAQIIERDILRDYRASSWSD